MESNHVCSAIKTENGSSERRRGRRRRRRGRRRRRSEREMGAEIVKENGKMIGEKSRLRRNMQTDRG